MQLCLDIAGKEFDSIAIDNKDLKYDLLSHLTIPDKSTLAKDGKILVACNIIEVRDFYSSSS